MPEAFLAGSATPARRWSLAYRERPVREDVTSLESIGDLARLKLLAMSLLSRVGKLGRVAAAQVGQLSTPSATLQLTTAQIDPLEISPDCWRVD